MKLNIKKTRNQTLWIYIVFLIHNHTRYCAGGHNHAVTFRPRDLYRLQVKALEPKNEDVSESYLGFLTVVCSKDQYKITASDPKNDKTRKITNITCEDAITVSFIKFETREGAKAAIQKFPKSENGKPSGNTLTKASLSLFFSSLAANGHEIIQVKSPLDLEAADYQDFRYNVENQYLVFEGFKPSRSIDPFAVEFSLYLISDPKRESGEFFTANLTSHDYCLYNSDYFNQNHRSFTQKEEIDNFSEEMDAYIKNKDIFKTPRPPTPNSDPPIRKRVPFTPKSGNNTNKPDAQSNDATEKANKDTGGHMKNFLIVSGVGGGLVVIIATIFFLKRRKEVEKKNRKAMKKNVPVK